MAFSLTAFGSVRWNGNGFEGTDPTTTDVLGPFYRPGAPMRHQLVPAGSKGIPMHLSGTVFKPDGKTPLAGTLIEVWQCDEHEVYDNTSDDYKFRGACKTGSDGKYYFDTIVPVPYKAGPTSWRPAHIHFRVSSPEYQDLITQIYFKGDSHLEEDAGSAAADAQHRILEMVKNTKGIQAVKFDIRIQKQFKLDSASLKKITGLYQLKDGTVEFLQEDDLLFMKQNGQLTEAMLYKGDNTFEGGMGYIKAKFNFLASSTEVVISMGDFDGKDVSKITSIKGERFLKY